MENSKLKLVFILLTVVLFIVFGGSLAWLSSQTGLATQEGFGFFLFLAYAAGLSMIVLPCTLPLVFVIVPLAAGKGYKKGFLMALLFGLGITITLTIYGVILGYLGKTLGLDRGSALVLPIIGFLAYLFGLSEIGLLRLNIPSFSMPQFITKRGDYGKALSMGLVLGNVGVACPNPLFYVLLAYMATLANPFSSATIAFVHGLGRATPLLLIALLAILGIEAGRFLAKKGRTIEAWTGFGLLVFGAFALVAWWFNLRGLWFLQTPPPLAAWSVFLALSIIPALIVWKKNKKHLQEENLRENSQENKANVKCPHCEHTQKVDIPQNGCLAFHKCEQCQKIISVPKESNHCCVICEYSDKKCPVANQNNL